MNNIHSKLLTADNLDEYLHIINNLSTTIESRDSILNLMTFYKIAELYPFIQIWLAQDYDTKKIIGCGTIIIEQKFIHKCGNVAHIEDVCILPEYQSKGYGKKIIEQLIDISKVSDCYKIILNCNEKNKGFYEKCGFKETNYQMSIYFTKLNK
jgi:glucosamine-phosphate N-acetyltransferase